MTKKDKRLKLVLLDKNFEPRYRKNIIIDFCHPQSESAKFCNCYICGAGCSIKERKKLKGQDYGYVFGQFYNKRHKKYNKYSKYSIVNYFTKTICNECIENIEKTLDYIFKKSYAP